MIDPKGEKLHDGRWPKNEDRYFTLPAA